MLAATFVVASGATYVAVNRWKAADNRPNTASQSDILEGVSGLSEGEVVTFPQLTNLTGETANLGNTGKDRLLCVFIGNRCPGCTRDADLWRDLHNAAPRRETAFYLVNIGDEPAEVEQFV